MIIYGTGEKKLSSPQQFVRSRCPQCGEFEVTFHFFRKYAHLFWIPMFPIGSRQVAFCEKCNASYQEGIPSSLRSDLEHAKSRTSFPLSLFSGSAIAVVLMAFFIYTDDGMTTYHYPDKSKKAEGRLVDNKQEGRWVYWHPNGKLQSEQYYRNGTEDSVWAWYNEEGVRIKEGAYKDGMYHGKWSFFYPSGKLQEEDNFFENRKSGPSVVYFEDGSKASEGSYLRDREDGSWTYWYMNGNKQAEGAYVGGEKKGLWKYYYENGKLSNETDTQDSGEYIVTVYDEEGQLMVKDGNGTSVIRYPTGEKANEGSIRNGRYEGRWRSWFPNGKAKEEGFYREGVYSLTNSWDAEGQPMVTVYYSPFVRPLLGLS